MWCLLSKFPGKPGPVAVVRALQKAMCLQPWCDNPRVCPGTQMKLVIRLGRGGDGACPTYC